MPLACRRRSHGPYARAEDYLRRVETAYRSDDPAVYTIVDRARDKAVGQASYLSIDPSAGSIEVGGIVYAPSLQHTPAGTEAMYLMRHRREFELLAAGPPLAPGGFMSPMLGAGDGIRQFSGVVVGIGSRG